LKPKKAKQVELMTNGKPKFNPEAVNDESVIKEIIRAIHGEYGKTEAIERVSKL
jgi:hypothetical protein